MKQLIVLTVGVVAALAFSLAYGFSKADAHEYSNRGSSVDLATEEIRFVDNTTYDGALDEARQRWNALDTKWNGEGVRLREVSNIDNAQVRVVDYQNGEYDFEGDGVFEHDNAAGFYDARYNPDIIGFNKDVMPNRNRDQKIAIAVHEFGHALGFTHPPASEQDALLYTSIMHPCGWCGGLKSPGPHDEQDYYNKWIVN